MVGIQIWIMMVVDTVSNVLNQSKRVSDSIKLRKYIQVVTVCHSD